MIGRFLCRIGWHRWEYDDYAMWSRCERCGKQFSEWFQEHYR